MLLSSSSYWCDVAVGVAITAGIAVSAYQQLRAQRTRVNVNVEPAAAS